MKFSVDLGLLSNRKQPDEWAALRQIVIQRDGGQCIECGEPLTSPEAHIHHVVPRALGGADAVENLVTLCAACHAGRHLNLQVSLARRLIERWAWRLANWLDHELVASANGDQVGAVMRLFGVQQLHSGQLEVILAALRGESVLLISPTGSGKSLCFQAPVVMRSGTAYVIEPLKALMSDQVSGLHKKRIPATFINGDLGPQEKRLRYRVLASGALKFLYCAPERFDDQKVRPAEVAELTSRRPSFFVVDEAHCIDKWGDAFRPSYSQLGGVSRRLGSPPVLAFTATAGPRTRERILSSLGIPDARVFLHDVDRPNIALLRINEARESVRFHTVATLIRNVRNVPGGRSMIFAPTLKIGRKIVHGLYEEGIKIPFYHGQLRASERDFLQQRFSGKLQPAIDAIVCTNAFGMGIDIPDVRLVVHWQHPSSIEDYVQEFGRAGRDGHSSLAVMFTGPNDIGLLEFMLKKSLQSRHLPIEDLNGIEKCKKEAIREMSYIAMDKNRCARRAILRAFGQEQEAQRPFALRLLEWVFTERKPPASYLYCCDACARLGSGGELDWALRIVRAM